MSVVREDGWTEVTCSGELILSWIYKDKADVIRFKAEPNVWVASCDTGIRVVEQKFENEAEAIQFCEDLLN